MPPAARRAAARAPARPGRRPSAPAARADARSSSWFAPSESDLLARLDGEHLDLRVTQRLLVLGRGTRQLRDGPVMEGQRELRLEQLARGVRRVLWINDDVAADGDAHEIREVALADHLHIAEQARVAHVVDAEPVLQLEDEPHRLAAHVGLV